MKRIFIVTFIFLIGNNLTAQTKKELKEAQKNEDYQSNKVIIESGEYFFKPISASTEDGRVFNFNNDKSILTIIGNHSLAALPYLGATQMDKSTDSTSIGSITYQNDKINYNIKYNNKRKKIYIKFTTQTDDENFDIILTVSGKNKALLSIRSIRRDPIKYYGFVSKID
ncbi:DUF4251 domain-containing protein [Xanthomarina spongicola]|uniref:Uncharacterized protein DUF4251 n=1 Tax=Xanthomarina spongicola TaxID=570520 RepID=A0A316DT22_9FLAO|nr:DUF4251 domain-containing protein [Xanthomarina spongicola]PWK20339.1 uncharacterized protein DUF4251 [Xanthomarina spongicola]